MGISRREFLMAGGAAVIAAGSVPMLSGCAGLRRSDVKGNGAAVTGLNQDEIRILEFACLAPSGHNTQPWGVRSIAPYTWIITSDGQRWLPAVDPDQRETLLSIGAFIENLVVAAGCSGYEAKVKHLAKTPKDKHVAEVRLRMSRTDCPGNDCLESIKYRRIVRKDKYPDPVTLRRPVPLIVKS